jgi:uncharacterized membrane protein YuzA (DUF378 family)
MKGKFIAFIPISIFVFIWLFMMFFLPSHFECNFLTIISGSEKSLFRIIFTIVVICCIIVSVKLTKQPKLRTKNNKGGGS